jgi:hypothetical protein
VRQWGECTTTFLDGKGDRGSFLTSNSHNAACHRIMCGRVYMYCIATIAMFLFVPGTDFQSIASTMYLSTLMLTGQGGPDDENLPWYTKCVVLLTGIFSLGMFAIPASMLTWGFEAEAERMAKRHRQQQQRALMATKNENDTNSPQPFEDIDEEGEADHWSYSSCDYSTDEEYQKIIAGEGDEEDDDSVDPFREAIQKFLELDTDGSGTISLSEFLKFSLNTNQSEPANQQQRQQQVLPRPSPGGQPHMPQLGTPPGKRSSSPSLVGTTIETSDNSALAVRLVALELQVEENTKKLDRLCQGMEHLLRNQPK